jgi:hypothetical protein
MRFTPLHPFRVHIYLTGTFLYLTGTTSNGVATPVGTLTLDQERLHFSLWCMMASPLIAGNLLDAMSAETKGKILTYSVINCCT